MLPRSDLAHASGYVVGVGFGTLPGRAVVVRLSDGAVVGSAVHEYAHGVMDEFLAATGERLPPDLAGGTPLCEPPELRRIRREAETR